MPSIHKRPGLSPYWYAAFTDTNGRRRFRCTKETDRSAASAVAERWQREADTLSGRNGPPTVPLTAAPELLERFVALSQKARSGELTAEDGQSLVSALLVATGQEGIRVETARAVFNSYLADKKTTRAKSTPARYDSMASRFLASIGPRADRPLRSITAKDVRAFRDAELATGLNPTSVNLSLVFVRSVFENARRQGVVQTNVAEAVDALPGDSSERRALTLDEIGSLLAVATPDWQTAIYLAVYAGFRLSDATSLRWEQFDAERGIIMLRPKKESRAKKAKKRETVCPRPLAEWLRSRQGIGAAAITPTLYGRPTNRKNGLSAEFSRLLESAKIVRRFTGEGARRVADVGFHALRHSSASLAANAGISEDVRREQLGHASARVHGRYVHRDAEAMRNALDAMPLIGPVQLKPTRSRGSS